MRELIGGVVINEVEAEPLSNCSHLRNPVGSEPAPHGPGTLNLRSSVSICGSDFTEAPDSKDSDRMDRKKLNKIFRFPWIFRASENHLILPPSFNQQTGELKKLYQIAMQPGIILVKQITTLYQNLLNRYRGAM